MEGHRDCFRTLIRRTLRDELGLGQREAQEWAEYIDYWVHRAAVGMACKTACTGNWLGAAVFGGGAAIDYRGTYRAMRYCYFTKEGLKETFVDKVTDHLFGKLIDSIKWEARCPGLGLLLKSMIQASEVF
jgi:hypothetical protein